MPKGIYKRKPHSSEWRKKHSDALKGHFVSAETREKQRIGNLGRKRSTETKNKLSILAKQRIGEKNQFFRKNHSVEAKKKISESHKGKCFSRPPIIAGESHWNWKGGITEENHKQRTSQQCLKWKQEVFKNDSYTCQLCGDNKGGNLNAHHIYPWKDYEHLRFIAGNGITLCKKCHQKYHADRRKTIKTTS